MEPNEKETVVANDSQHEIKNEQEQKTQVVESTPVIKPEVIQKQKEEYIPPYMKGYDKNEKYYY